MFGLDYKAKYQKLLMEHSLLQTKYLSTMMELRVTDRVLSDLRRRWNGMVDKINAKGGEAFLDQNGSCQFSPEEIKSLIILCHPDKHNGGQTSVIATKITQKLLKMR